MNLILNLPPEIEAKLKAQAALTGKKPEDLALETLQGVLTDELASEPIVSPEEWLKLFESWVSGHRTRNPQLDDSRESFYPDRW